MIVLLFITHGVVISTSHLYREGSKEISLSPCPFPLAAWGMFRRLQELCQNIPQTRGISLHLFPALDNWKQDLNLTPWVLDLADEFVGTEAKDWGYVHYTAVWGAEVPQVWAMHLWLGFSWPSTARGWGPGGCWPRAFWCGGHRAGCRGKGQWPCWTCALGTSCGGLFMTPGQNAEPGNRKSPSRSTDSLREVIGSCFRTTSVKSLIWCETIWMASRTGSRVLSVAFLCPWWPGFPWVALACSHSPGCASCHSPGGDVSMASKISFPSCVLLACLEFLLSSLAPSLNCVSIYFTRIECLLLRKMRKKKKYI